MGFRNFLTESPYVGPSTQFSLNTDEGNRKSTDLLLKKTPAEIYEENDRYIFARYGSEDKGEIAWISKEKGEEEVQYYVEFKNLKIKGFHQSMTQTKVWRSFNLPISGLVEKVFFDVLFKKYGAITSDSAQTENGRDFWKRQMSIAHEKGYYIGLYDEDEWVIDWCSPESSFVKWSRSAYPEGWSSNDFNKEKYRFIISKHKIEST